MTTFRSICVYFAKNLVHFWLGIYFLSVLCKADDGLIGCKPRDAGPNSTYPLQREILTFLKNDQKVWGKMFTYDGSDGNYKYNFRICMDVSHDKPGILLNRVDTVESDDLVLGFRNATSVWGNKGKWMMLNFLGPKNVPKICDNGSISSSVMMVCDPNYSQGDFSLITEDRATCSFLFELRWAALCSDVPGMSGWSVLFIIILVCFLCYFIIGILFLRLQKGARGAEQIPQRHFWFAIGNKLAEGCSAVCRCDQYCGHPTDNFESQSPYVGGGGYSPIGGSSPATITSHNTERDAPMLNP